ncbi:MAG: hypothetical protein CMJ94_07925 [Planctomycetes bacterium]|nr:hypothetical protein [Planctomycetota bacterium]
MDVLSVALGAAFGGGLGFLLRARRRRRARLDCEAKSEDLHEALRSFEAGVWVWEVETGRVHWDAALKRIFRVPEGSFGGTAKAGAKLITRETRERAREHLRHTFRNDVPFTPTLRLASDPSVEIQGYGKLRRDAAGRPVRMTGVFVDVTQERELQRELAESEWRFRVTFEETAVGIAHIGLDGTWLRFNRAVTDLLGYEPEQLRQLTFQDITHPDDLGPDEERVAQVLVGEIDRYSMEKRYLHADGHYLWANLTVSLVRDENGEPHNFISVIQDIAEQKKLEAELKKLNRELESRVEKRTEDLRSSNEALEQFAYIASHDLQEPLRTISSYLTLLERRHGDSLNAEAKEFVDVAVDGATRARALVAGVLQYSRLRSDEARPDWVLLQELAEEVLTGMADSVAEAEAQVELDLQVAVFGSRAQLFQLFQNLIGNSLRYRGGKPAFIRITAERDADGEVEIRFDDRGEGIAPAYHEEVFQLFRRLHPKGPDAGTGMGLAICRRIARNHHGSIEVDPDYKQGARFRVRIPRLSELAEEQQAGPAASPSTC